MKKIFVIAILAISLCVNGQQKGRIDGFNLENFPEVSFVYHTNNPEKLSNTNFSYLKEDGSERDFELNYIPNNSETGNQHTIILWEDMAINGFYQFSFTKESLIKFFDEIEFSNKEQFAIYAFNRRKNNPTVLRPITDGFTTNKGIIRSNIQSYKPSAEEYREYPKCSDLYTAVRESMEILAPLQGTKSIILFTSGYPMKNSGSDSESQVLKKAQDLHIPVYVFLYACRSGAASNTEGFANSTYGTYKAYRSSEKIEPIEQSIASASSDLIKLYPQIEKRYQGNDYKITFTSNAKKGEEARMIKISVDGVEIQEQLLPPPMTFAAWIEQNTILFIVILLVVVALIISLILFIVKSKKRYVKQQEELMLQQQQTKEIEEQRKKDKSDYEERERERLAQEEAKRRAEEIAKWQAEQERLTDLMRMKNLYPRITCDTGTDKFVYDVDKPYIKIGREYDNDMVIEKPTVSRYHAEIVFNGNAFEIYNKSQTNKVIVNGCFVDRGILKSNDKIGLGEVVITFYV